METKEYYEINLPGYLQHDLDAMKEGKWPYDCYNAFYLMP